MGAGRGDGADLVAGATSDHDLNALDLDPSDRGIRQVRLVEHGDEVARPQAPTPFG